MRHLFPFWRERSTHSRLYPCPACNETISADASACRFCHLPIDASTAQRLLKESQRVITAIAEAKTFSLSKRLAAVLAGFALLNLYIDRSLAESLVLCSFAAFSYGALWLGRNRPCVTQDADYPAAITTVKGTMAVWVAVLLLHLGTYVTLNGWRRVVLQLPQPLAHKIIRDGNNRPVLSIAGVKADHFPLFPGETNPWRFPLLVVRFQNNGNTTARLTKATLKSYSPSSGCDFTLEGTNTMNIVIPPGYEDEALFGAKVGLPCKTAGLIKLTVVYTNVASGLEYTQEVSAAADLVFGDS